LSAAGFDALTRDASKDRSLGGRLQRPRDAGTLIIVDDSDAAPRVLMGRRAASHVFMAGRFVFPGGRVDPADLRMAAGLTLDPHACDRLAAMTRASFDTRRSVAIALAAIRETFEEVGVLIGAEGAVKAPRGTWEAFAARSIRPDPAALVPIARAITPPGRTRRFDTRFFVIRASAIRIAGSFDERPTDEFDAVDWFTFEGVEDLNLAPITRQVLSHLRARIGDGTWLDPRLPMPFYRSVRGQFVRDLV